MGPKKELLSTSSFLKERELENKKILTENEVFIVQIKNRVDHNLAILQKDGDGGQKYPMDMQQCFNDVTARKKDNEFIKKGRFSFHCSLNTFNNALPSGMVVTVKTLNVLRDLKLYHLAVKHMKLTLEKKNEQVIYSLYLPSI